MCPVTRVNYTLGWRKQRVVFVYLWPEVAEAWPAKLEAFINCSPTYNNEGSCAIELKSIVWGAIMQDSWVHAYTAKRLSRLLARCLTMFFFFFSDWRRQENATYETLIVVPYWKCTHWWKIILWEPCRAAEEEQRIDSSSGLRLSYKPHTSLEFAPPLK